MRVRARIDFGIRTLQETHARCLEPAAVAGLKVAVGRIGCPERAGPAPAWPPA